MTNEILMPQPGQKGLTFKAGFVEGIGEFVDKNPELGWTSVPEAVRHAWNKFVVEYEKEKRARALQNEEQ